MSRGVQFTIGLIAALGLLTWGASVIVLRTARTWFERDVNLRSQLVVHGARQALLSHWQPEQRRDIQQILTEITHDERILAAAACNADRTLLASTPDFPVEFSCAQIGAQLQVHSGPPGSPWAPWKKVTQIPGGTVHVSAFPVSEGEFTPGFVILVHDLSFVERREAATRNFLIVAFGILALAASGVTVISARLAWRGWSAELRRFIRGDTQRAEFLPILRDVRELVDRIAAEKETEGEGGTWTPVRLKDTLNRHLHGEKVIIVANREPYIHERANGGVKVVHPASGLVTALEPVLRACSGAWIAHGSGSADRETTDAHGRVRVPPGEESYFIRRVWLTPEEEKGYYYGFSNEGLWPLCHIAHARPRFSHADWQHYRTVNERFVDAVCQEVDVEDPIVLVQDYHFALVPRLLRERLPQATVIAFWHIPWPNSENFGICPWRKELLDGMLGASILGFHTQFHCNNFLDCVDRFLEARIDREENAVVQQGRTTFVRPYPISLEWPIHWLKDIPSTQECRAEVFSQLGLPANALLGVGVDRLDYTKGVEERLLAVERLLEQYPEYRGRFRFVQLAAPSRTLIERYRQLNDSVEQLAARINQRFGDGAYQPVILRRAHHEPPVVYRYYRAADLCYVSSLHDGMNLVAKEFVAARDDEHGVLLLSQFTGAARELTEALIVNPYDLAAAGAAMAAALRMPVAEQADRMRAMRTFLAEFNVYRWAGRMLVDAARLRRHERLAGRLAEPRVREASAPR